jgi:alanine racemase
VAEGRTRPAWAEIDLGALAHNTALLARLAAPAGLCAVVKADGYGHGAAAVARTVLRAGAASLAVALVDEGVELRRAGIEAPVLLLSEPPPGSAGAAVAAGLTPTVYSPRGVAEVAAAVSDRNRGRWSVHVKVDTGMHRVGAVPADLPDLVSAVLAEPGLRLEGVWTHLAVADGPSDEDRQFTQLQLDRFAAVTEGLAAAGVGPLLRHAANSAALIAHPGSRLDMVRPGIALFGQLPGPAVAAAWAAGPPGSALRPVLSLKARVSAVRELAAGERPSYGRLRPLAERSVVATVPLGYADGLPRALFAGGLEVLIGGRRHPLAGMVTMDQIMVDCGPGSPVIPGDEVVLLGRQGDQEITADEWAGRLGTISYEVLTGIGPRVPRVVVGVPEGPADR